MLGLPAFNFSISGRDACRAGPESPRGVGFLGDISMAGKPRFKKVFRFLLFKRFF